MANLPVVILDSRQDPIELSRYWWEVHIITRHPEMFGLDDLVGTILSDGQSEVWTHELVPGRCYFVGRPVNVPAQFLHCELVVVVQFDPTPSGGRFGSVRTAHFMRNFNRTKPGRSRLW